MATVAEAEDRLLGGWSALLQAHASVVRRLEGRLWRGEGLSLAGHMVLHRLAVAGGHLRMSELAETMLLSPSGASRLVDRLVAPGLVERQPCDSDGRAVHAAITERGRVLLKRSRAVLLKALGEVYGSHFNETELERLTELLSRLGGRGPTAAC